MGSAGRLIVDSHLDGVEEWRRGSVGKPGIIDTLKPRFGRLDSGSLKAIWDFVESFRWVEVR